MSSHLQGFCVLHLHSPFKQQWNDLSNKHSASHFLVNALNPNAVHFRVRPSVPNAATDVLALHLPQSVPLKERVQLIDVEEIGERPVLSRIQVVLNPARRLEPYLCHIVAAVVAEEKAASLLQSLHGVSHEGIHVVGIDRRQHEHDEEDVASARRNAVHHLVFHQIALPHGHPSRVVLLAILPMSGRCREHENNLNRRLCEVARVHLQVWNLFAQREKGVSHATSHLKQHGSLLIMLRFVCLFDLVQLLEYNVEIVSVFEEAVSIVTVEIVPILASVVVEFLYSVTRTGHALRAQ